MAAPVTAAAAAEGTRGKRAAISIALITALLGLPLWWKTTETYRASLPFTEISQLDRLQLQLTVPIEIVFAKGTLSTEQQRKLPSSDSKNNEVVLNSHTRFNCHYAIKYRRISSTEEETLTLQSVKDTDEALQQLDQGEQGSISLYILPETSSLLSQGVSVYIGKHRRAFVKCALDQSARIEDFLRTLYKNVQRVIQTMSFNGEAVTAALSDRIPISRFSKDDFENSRRAFKSSPGYDITFSLLNPDPKSLDVNWNISSASDQYIQPFLDKLQPVANFSVDSQILYYAVLGVTPRFEKSSSSYIINANNLPHVINPVEARLGSSAASLYPVLNFLLYVPEYFHSPLHIQDKDGNRVPTNAFHSPRWGGIMVYNVDYKSQGEQEPPIYVDIDMVQVMEIFLTQLRLLLGITKVYVPENYMVENPGNEGLTDWELDKLLWSRTVENIATVSTTLTSLAQLLDQIGNIVINDNVASEVYRAVSSVQIAMTELDAGRLEFAFQASKEAITSSEKAFFDPSLLHLLYFPDDQKFAIYIPLFLPMAVPILLSLLKIAKEYKASKKEAIKVE
ncbi:GPI transamidase component PIG-S [Pelobates cultripes]|uniref:GPI transamidase component PIG-S n=1 Tax=Pelobates cultripes TaxID=61616 RepID=A0AAD1QY86_PELCU|nr:GPI transamidase component PIG-S [Pelobates cultripes]